MHPFQLSRQKECEESLIVLRLRENTNEMIFKNTANNSSPPARERNATTRQTKVLALDALPVMRSAPR
jgi:hypothetical protein